MSAPGPLDLVLLVPGKDEKAVLETLLGERVRSLEIRRPSFETAVHPRKDPGCLREAHEFLRIYQHRAKHALVVFDHEGCGREGTPPLDLEEEVRSRLADSGWGDRADALVIAPELEVWLWSDSPRLDEHLGWAGRNPPLREWLRAGGLWRDGEPKPHDPKAAVEAALSDARIPRSSSIYAGIARDVGLKGCRDGGFRRLRDILTRWFGT